MLSIYTVPYFVASLLVGLDSDVSEVFLHNEEFFSIVLSLVTVFVIGLVISKKIGTQITNALTIGIPIFLINVIGLATHFTLLDLVHDILLIPIILLSNYCSRRMGK